MNSKRKLLLLDSQLAELIGDKEAIVLCQLNYWIENNKKKRKNYIDGKYWVFSTVENWQENNFPFWSKNTVRRIINSLVENDYVFTEKFYQNKNNHTKSYTINYLKLQKEFNFTFITEKNNDLPKITPNIDKLYNSLFTKNENLNYPKWVNRIDQNEQKELPKMGKSLKENNKKINNYIINTTPTSYTNYSDDDYHAVGGNRNINFKNISLEYFSTGDIELAKSIINLMQEVATSSNKFNISGQKVSGTEFYSKFKDYSENEVRYVIDVVRDTKNIKYPRAFMLNVLYHANTMMDIYYQNKVNNPSDIDIFSDNNIARSLELLGGN